METTKGYSEIRQDIINALTGRPEGSLIFPEQHQEFALEILDFANQIGIASVTGLVGEATPSTQPIQPDDSNLAYIFQVSPDTTKTFSNFHDYQGNPISVTTNSTQVAFGFLVWNKEYWSAITVMLSVSTPAFDYVIRDRGIIQMLDGEANIFPLSKAAAVTMEDIPIKNLATQCDEKSVNLLRLLLSAEGTSSLLFNGFVTSENSVAFDGNGQHKVLVARVKGNKRYRVFVPQSDPDSESIGLYLFLDASFNSLMQSSRVIHRKGEEVWLLSPSDAVYFAITAKINNMGQPDKVEFGGKESMLLTPSLIGVANADVSLLNKLRSYITSLGTPNLYYPGAYITSNANQIAQGDEMWVSNEHKLLLAHVIPGVTYKAYMKYSGGSGNYGAYAWYDEDFQPIDSVPRSLVSNTVTELVAPEGAYYFGLTLELNSQGDYKSCYFIEKTEYIKQLEQRFDSIENAIKDSFNPIINTNKGVSIINFPWKEGSNDLSEFVPHYYKEYKTEKETDFQFVSDPRFNQKCLHIEGSWAAYEFCQNFKIYKNDFYQKWDEKFFINLFASGKMLFNGDLQTIQCFITLFYGETVSYIENLGGNYILENSQKAFSYANHALYQGASVVAANNPGKDFTVSGGLLSGTYNYPIYPSILDGNGNELPFTGILIQLLNGGESSYEYYDVYPVVVCVGENSINSFNLLPNSYSDSNLLINSDFLLNSEKTKIKSSLLPDSDDSQEIIISPLTSDKMAFYGCSYTESYYAIKNKSWLNKLSNMLDLPTMNFGVSGNRIVDMSLRLRQNGNPYGNTGIKQMKPTYIVIQNIGNESLHTISGANLELYMAQVKEMVEDIKAIGAIPVLGTDFFVSNKSMDTQLKNFADSLGIIYCPIGAIGEIFTMQKYAGFWGSDHPATRTNEETAEEWYHQLKFLTVNKSVKIFRVRDEFAAGVSSVDDLNYDLLYQRFRKFIEINVGELSLNEANESWKRYDSLQPISGYSSQNNHNEYGDLIGGLSLEFSNYALIEFISPRVKCSAVIQIPSSTAGLKFYMKNACVPVQPYSTSRNGAAFYVTKQVWEDFNASVGDEFTSDASGSSILTYAGKVMGQEYGGYMLLFDALDNTWSSDYPGYLVNVQTSEQTPYLRAPHGAGRYRYSFYERINEPVSYFVEVPSTYEDGIYTIQLDNYDYWEYDKLKIIIEKSGTFSLSAPSCKVIGGEDKVKSILLPKPKQGGETELTESTGFGSSEYNNNWTKEEGIIWEKMPSDIKDYPQFTNDDSHVVLTQKDEGFSNEIYKTFTIPQSRGYRKMYVRVTARLFPKIYNQETNDDYHTTTRQITPTSNDYGRLVCEIKVANSQTPAVCEAFVGCGWSEKFFELLIPPFATSVTVGLYRNPHDFEETEKLARNWPMQVCDVSVSMMNM